MRNMIEESNTEAASELFIDFFKRIRKRLRRMRDWPFYKLIIWGVIKSNSKPIYKYDGCPAKFTNPRGIRTFEYNKAIIERIAKKAGYKVKVVREEDDREDRETNSFLRNLE